MSDLISRQALLAKIREVEEEPDYLHEGESWVTGLAIAESLIERAELSYPKKGKWIVFAVDDARGRRTGRHTLICNQCHCERELEYGEKMPKFCGNCGVDMREEE